MISSNDISLVRSGDEKAFVELYHGLNGRVFNYFLKKVRDREMAKDLTQQCFIRVYHYRASLSLDHPLEKQVYIIARSVLLNELRAESRKKARDIRYVRERYPAGEATGSQPDAGFETRDYLDKITSPLSPVRRKVILLKARQGMSNQEIADELSISVKTVENHITKANQHLRIISTGLASFVVFLSRL